MDTSNNLAQNTTLNSTLNNSTNTVDFANTTTEQTNLLDFVENFSTSSPNFRTSSQIRPKISTVRPMDRPSRIDQIRSRNIARQRHSRERFVVTRGQNTQKALTHFLDKCRRQRLTRRARRGEVLRMGVNAINNHKPLVTQDKKKVVGLPGLFDVDLLGELTGEYPFLGPMRTAIINKDVQSFNKLGTYMAQCWTKAAVVNNCVLKDNKLAIPEQLRSAILIRLHRSHPGQAAMMDASEYIWWPFLNRQIVNVCEKCPECTLFAQGLERNLLTPEQRSSQDYSRDRAKVVPREPSHSPEIPFKFKPLFGVGERIADSQPYKALENLAKAANTWKQWKRNVPPQQGQDLLRELAARNSDLANSLKTGITKGTLRFYDNARDTSAPALSHSQRMNVSSSSRPKSFSKTPTPGTVGERLQRRIAPRPQSQPATTSATRQSNEPSKGKVIDLTVESSSEDSLITGPQLELVEAPVSTPQGLAPVIATSTTPIVDPPTHPALTSTTGAVAPPQDLPQTSDKVPQNATEDSANTGHMEVDNPTSQSSSEFRSSNRSKKPTRFYGDPLRHSVKSVTESDSAEPSSQRHNTDQVTTPLADQITTPFTPIVRKVPFLRTKEQTTPFKKTRTEEHDKL